MTSEKAKSAIILGVIVLVAMLVFGGLTFFLLKLHAQAVKTRALAELKKSNPVEYYLLHTAKTQSDDEERQPAGRDVAARGIIQSPELLFPCLCVSAAKPGRRKIPHGICIAHGLW